MKLFPNFTSIPFDYLLISWVTNYVSNRGFLTCLSWIVLIDRELHSLKRLELKFILPAEAFPLCFSALYCLSLRGFGCSRFVLVVSVPTSADSRLGFLLSMRIRYLQDLGGNHMTKLVVEPVLSTRASFLY